MTPLLNELLVLYKKNLPWPHRLDVQGQSKGQGQCCVPSVLITCEFRIPCRFRIYVHLKTYAVNIKQLVLSTIRRQKSTFALVVSVLQVHRVKMTRTAVLIPTPVVLDVPALMYPLQKKQALVMHSPARPAQTGTPRNPVPPQMQNVKVRAD